MTSFNKTALLFLCSAVISMITASCSLAPLFHKPEVTLDEAWIGVALQAQQDDKTLAAHDLHWQHYFLDPYLQQLIAEALKNNHDLKIAGLTAEQVQTDYRINRSESLPTLVGSASGKRTKTPKDLSPTGKTTTTNMYSVGLGITAYELDFFGRIKNQNAAMINQYLATLEAKDSAQLAIIATVAKTYYSMRTNHNLMTLAKKVREIREKSLELTRLQVEAGTATEATLQGMIAAIELAKADYQERTRSWQQSRNNLGLLIGRPLSQLKPQPGADLSEQFPEKKLFAGIPAEILLHRPDIREAEYALKAANANIGVARAAFFPSITLTGNAGFGSDSLNSLFDNANFTWTFAPRLDLPFFDYGRRKAKAASMKIQRDIAVEKYRKTVRNAFTDINNALIARKTLEHQVTAIRKSNSAIKERLKLITIQLREGFVDGLALLDAERESFGSQQKLLAVQLMALNNHVDLYTAMGGGLQLSAKMD